MKQYLMHNRPKKLSFNWYKQTIQTDNTKNKTLTNEQGNYD